MIELFLSYTGTDKIYIDSIIHNLCLETSLYKLWYYDPLHKTPMEEVFENLNRSDIFILILSNNSLNSPLVQEEARKAIELKQLGQLKGIYLILIDNFINLGGDNIIPQCLKTSLYYASSPVIAAEIIEEIAEMYNTDSEVGLNG